MCTVSFAILKTHMGTFFFHSQLGCIRSVFFWHPHLCGLGEIYLAWTYMGWFTQSGRFGFPNIKYKYGIFWDIVASNYTISSLEYWSTKSGVAGYRQRVSLTMILMYSSLFTSDSWTTLLFPIWAFSSLRALFNTWVLFNNNDIVHVKVTYIVSTLAKIIPFKFYKQSRKNTIYFYFGLIENFKLNKYVRILFTLCHI